MSRHKFVYNPVPFDQIICPPVGVQEGRLKEGDIVYKGKSLGFNSYYIYTKDNKFLGLISKNSLEKVI